MSNREENGTPSQETRGTENVQLDRATVKDLLIEYANTSGFPIITRLWFYYSKSRWLSFAIWILIGIVCFTLMSNFLRKLKMSYDEAPYATKVQEMNPSELQYPTIAICELVRVADKSSNGQIHYRNTVGEKFNFSERLIAYLTIFQNDPAYIDNFNETNVLDEYEHFKATQNISNIDWFRDLLTQITQKSCESFFINPGLAAASVSVYLSKFCKYFAIPMLTNREFCYILRLRALEAEIFYENVSSEFKPMAQVAKGINGGLDIYVNSTDQPWGICLTFSHHSIFPINENQIVVEKDKEIRITLTAKVTLKTDGIESCTNQLKTERFPQYSKSACLYECRIQDILRVCRCLPIGWNITNLDGSRWCEPPDLQQCYLPNYVKSHDSTAMEKRIRKCVDRCPPPCKMWSFTHETSVRPFIQGVIRIRIYFDDISYQTVSIVSLLTPEGILGAIGGVAGFWFQASLLSIIHLFVWSVEMLQVCFIAMLTKFKTKKEAQRSLKVN